MEITEAGNYNTGKGGIPSCLCLAMKTIPCDFHNFLMAYLGNARCKLHSVKSERVNVFSALELADFANG